MFLKRITLFGFKSFPDKTDFDFGPGVTGIVGPNGCGKSNIVDAFRWVLGEQSARSLRGRQMSDMIFNGSSTRRSTSLAQVDLVFDNTDRKLGVDQSEVVVTRKLYRSGDSEYQLNREAARLKDIRELFMDTGIGVDAYSVIEQGRVDGLLQSNPTDRRFIFEEAAGISKYKARRKEAQRKLERTQQNLLRVEDIIAELEKRLRSVKLQAGKARSYQEYQTRLNELRANYALAEYHRFSQQLEQLNNEAQQHNDAAVGMRAEIGRHEANESQLTSRLDALAEDINRADAEFLGAKSQLLAQEERIDSARRRAEEQRALLERITQRHAADAQRLEENKRRMVETQNMSVALEEQKRDLRGRIVKLEEEDRECARELTQAQAILEDEKAGIIDLLRRSAQLHNEIVRLNTHRESLVDQKGRLSQRDATITAELERALEQRLQLERRVVQLDDVIAKETEKLEEKKTAVARATALRQRLAENLADLKEQRSALRSRRELLEDLQRRMEGVGTAARRILDRKREADAPTAWNAVVGIVADIFDADVAHARVIEAALGEATQQLVVQDSGALSSQQELFGELPGRLTAICLDRIPPMVNPRDFSEHEGFVARALELVRYPDAFERLAYMLLGKTIVVETLSHALAMSALDVSGHRFVTRDGELVDADGRVTLGPPSASAGLISRRSELRDIEASMYRIDEQLATVSDQLNRSQAEHGHLESVIQELRTSIYEASTAKIEARSGLGNVDDVIQRLTREQPLIVQEVTMLEHQISEVLAKSESEGQSLGAVERENEERERRVVAHQERLDAIVTQRQDIREILVQSRVEAGQLEEKQAGVATQLHAIQRAIDELESALSTANQDRGQCEARIKEAEDQISNGESKLEELGQSIHELEARCAELRRQRELWRCESEEIGQAVKSARSRLEEAEAKLHACQMTVTEVSVRRDDLIARVAEELGLQLPERYAQYEAQEQDWAQVEAEIAELRAKMDRLGNVNLDAIAELEELEQRYAFLSTQRDDLTRSHRQLEQLIDRLNRESQERFSRAFEQIRENFRSLFRKLFGGGRADIVLEDPENVLESGIEIVAQPPGKELRAISLMSGGEKSLTAIALLMSVFKSRPAPCTFLDEVDAALDEANNDRFNRIIREFVKDTQFIVVTHSKWTMNIAEHLYGITMQEPGISTRVSVELSRSSVA